MSSLFDCRFILNTGKGGVGKTTVSAAMAVAFAKRGKRVLLMELNVRDKIGPLFGKPEVGPEIVQLEPGISAVNTTPHDSLREYAMMVVKVKFVYRAVFENRLVARFLRAAPGLRELVMLGKAAFHEGETDRNGRKVWDVVIIDAPATGHGVFLLQIPQVISQAVSSGSMFNESRAIVDLLRDPKRTSINIITLAEEMPVNETIELRHRLRAEFGIDPGSIIANGIWPPELAGPEVRQAEDLLDAHGRPDDELGHLLASGVFRARRCELQRSYIDRLHRELQLPLIEIPFQFTPRVERQGVERMAAHVTEAVERQSRKA